MKNNKQAITLIELLVVVLIIGILASVALPQYRKAVDKAHFTELLNAIRPLRDMQEIYYLANGEYAKDCEELGAEFPGYNLNSKKQLVNNKNHFVLDCQRGITDGDNGYDRVEGLTTPIQITFGFMLSHAKYVNSRNKMYCYAVNTSTYHQQLCQSFCGELEPILFQGKGCYMN